jgi:hypothetical protein
MVAWLTGRVVEYSGRRPPGRPLSLDTFRPVNESTIRPFFQFPYRGSVFLADPSMVHWVKSMGFPHPLQVWGLLNSSEKISFSFPHSGHLQIKELRF